MQSPTSIFNPRCVTSQRDGEAGGGICRRVIGWQQAQIQPALVNFPQLEDKLKPPVCTPSLGKVSINAQKKYILSNLQTYYV